VEIGADQNNAGINIHGKALGMGYAHPCATMFLYRIGNDQLPTYFIL